MQRCASGSRCRCRWRSTTFTFSIRRPGPRFAAPTCIHDERTSSRQEGTMRIWRTLFAVAAGVALSAAAHAQQTTLRIFTGGQQRPDVMRKIADEYQKRNPNVKVEVEVGGATSDVQQQYLSTVLSSKDSVLDVILIDVIRPAQWAAQGWAEPLDAYLGADKQRILSQYIKAYSDANQVGGKLISL